MRHAMRLIYQLQVFPSKSVRVRLVEISISLSSRFSRNSDGTSHRLDDLKRSDLIRREAIRIIERQIRKEGQWRQRSAEVDNDWWAAAEEQMQKL